MSVAGVILLIVERRFQVIRRVVDAVLLLFVVGTLYDLVVQILRHQTNPHRKHLAA